MTNSGRTKRDKVCQLRTSPAVCCSSSLSGKANRNRQASRSCDRPDANEEGAEEGEGGETTEGAKQTVFRFGARPSIAVFFSSDAGTSLLSFFLKLSSSSSSCAFRFWPCRCSFSASPSEPTDRPSSDASGKPLQGLVREVTTAESVVRARASFAAEIGVESRQREVLGGTGTLAAEVPIEEEKGEDEWRAKWPPCVIAQG
jgi:hypothetical protein